MLGGETGAIDQEVDPTMLKRLLNLPESVTDLRLREVCEDFDAKVFAKVRVADVLPIENSGIDDEHYRYSLRAHFDFVVTDDSDQPLFAVEFDGASHTAPDAQRRDGLKNDLCVRFELPLLRVNRKYLDREFSNWDLLRWFCTVFFVKRTWDKDVEAGRIPPDDSIFDPMFVSVKTKHGFRSLELEGHARAALGRFFRAGRIPSHKPNFITAEAPGGVLRAIAWISTSELDGALAETAMQCQFLDSWVQFAVRGIVLSELRNRVSAILAGSASPVPLVAIEQQVKEFEGKYKLIMALRSG